MTDGYVVSVKPSARRASSVAGTWVAESGPRRRFGSKALAREWARRLSGPDRTLWVQDAHPRDSDSADGYLLARRRHSTPTDDTEQAALSKS
ncbi:MAG: hypothetical protein PPP58_07695 [Natronomonas sp.]